MRHLRFYGPWVLHMGFIFWASSQRQLPSPLEAPDYVLHGGTFFVLGLLSVRAFASGLAEPQSIALLAGAFAFTVLYGMSDEWHQSFVPGRDASLKDVAADAVGALIAVSAIGVFWKVSS